MRTRIVVPVLAVLVASAVQTATASAAPAHAPAPSTWLQPGYNAANSNDNPAERIVTAKTVTRLHRQHTYTVTANNQCVYDAPGAAFSQSSTYVVDGGRVSRYRSSDGKLLWTRTAPKTDDIAYNRIMVSHGLVMTSGNECGTTDPYGPINAYRADTGKPVWSVAGSFDGLAAAAVSGRYLVGVTLNSIDAGGRFAVFDVQTGKPVWSTSAATTNNLCDVEIGVVRGQLFQRSCPGEDASRESLQAVSLASGKVTWSKRGAYTVLRGDSDTSAARHLYVQNDTTHAVLDLDPRTGHTRATLHGATSVFAVDAHRVYGECGAGSVCAWATSTRTVLWRGTDPKQSLSGIVAGSVLYLGFGDVLDANTGRTLRTFPTAPALVGSGRVGFTDGSAARLTVYGV